MSYLVLSSIVDEDKSKELVIYKGVPNADLGNSFINTNYNVPMEKVTNGYNFRNKIVNGSVIIGNTINTTITDSTTVNQTFFNITIPGGTLIQNDSVLFNFNLGGNLSGYNIYISFSTYRQYSGVVGNFYRNSANTGTMSITFTAKDSNIFYFGNSSSFYSSSGGNYRLCNLLNDITITVYAAYSGTPTGRTMTVTNPKLTFTNVKPPLVADITQYRLPDKQPFKKTSIWNVPLSKTCIYGDNTHPMAVLIKDRWAGKAVKSGSQTNYRFINSGFTGGIPVYYLKSSDPITSVVVNTTYPRQHTPYPFIAPNSSNRINIRMPKTALAGGQSTDKILVLVSEDLRYIYEVGGYSFNTTTNSHSFGTVYTHDLYGSGLPNKWSSDFSTTVVTPNLASTTYAFQQGHRAGGTPAFGGLVRTDELINASIQHVIGMELDPLLLRTNRVYVFSTDAVAKTITIYPRSTYVTSMDYSSLFVANQPVSLGGVVYTCTGINSYNATNNQTTLGVNQAITSTATALYLGSNANNQFDYKYQYPMAEADGVSDDTNFGYRGLIPLGQVFAIPKSVDLTTLGLTREGFALAKAFQDFGGIIDDVTGGTFALAQTEAQAPSALVSNLNVDKDIIISYLVPILNYDRIRVQDAINDVTIIKPKDLIPLYTAT